MALLNDKENPSASTRPIADDFRYRQRQKWFDGQLPPAAAPSNYVMVRLWNGRRCYYSVYPREIGAFCEWLEWHHSTAVKLSALAIRGVRCIHVVRLPRSIYDLLPKKRHQKNDELPMIIEHLINALGEQNARTVLHDFF